NLTDISALEDINLEDTTMLTIRNNALLSECNIDSFCEYLDNDPATHPRYIAFNTGDCSSAGAVIAVCEPQPVCPPDGNITFNTQPQLDDFFAMYPNCTRITGHVLISGGMSVENLSGLQNIEVITGGFTIWANQ